MLFWGDFMFSWRFQNNQLDLVGEGITLKGISLAVNRPEDGAVDLALQSVSGDTASFGADFATASLCLKQANGVLCLMVTGGLIRDRSKQLFCDRVGTTLSATSAVTVTVREIAGLCRWNASKIETFWTVPYLGTDLEKIPDSTQGLLCETASGFTTIYAPCDRKYKASFSGNSTGLVMELYSTKPGMMQFDGMLCCLASGTDPFALPEQIVSTALPMLGKTVKLAKDKRYPEIFEYLGWCSWDAFPLSVTHEGMMKKAQEFREKNIPVRWAIVDDMWATLDGENTRETMHDRKLVDFRANPEQFPNGLKAAIADMNEKYGIKVGIWHPVTGYWHGFAPNGATAKECAAYLTENVDGRLVVRPTATDMFGYHNYFYQYLKDAGAEFVKVDCQSSLGWFYSGMGTVGEMAAAMHQGIEGAVGVHFGGDMINCMGCSAENIWNRPDSVVNRCSADFLPENKSWFIKHIMQCTSTCYFYSPLFVGDFDMFWTDDSQAERNCVLRAISGGPIYVSDMVGRSVAERLLPCVLADGRILRCNESARPTADCLTVDPRNSNHPYKVWNVTDHGLVMAAFHLNEAETSVSGEIDPWALPAANADAYLAYDFFAGAVRRLNRGETIAVTLKDQEQFAFYNFLPIVDGFAPIGLTDKYVTSATFAVFGEKKYLVKNGGDFAYYAETAPKTVLVDGVAVQPTICDGYAVVALGEKATTHTLEFIF